MLENLENMKDARSLPELQARFAGYLGVEDPVPLGVIHHALDDQYYRHNLILCRSRPDMLARLFAHPKNAEYEARLADGEAAADPAERAAIERGNLELAAQAGQAMFKWGKAGFALVDQATYDRRFGACQSCEHLVAAPDMLLYKLIKSKRNDPRVCRACGCTAARKARLATESCPVADPDDATLNRWGEPLPEDAPPIPALLTGETGAAGQEEDSLFPKECVENVKKLGGTLCSQDFCRKVAEHLDRYYRDTHQPSYTPVPQEQDGKICYCCCP